MVHAYMNMFADTDSWWFVMKVASFYETSGAPYSLRSQATWTTCLFCHVVSNNAVILT